MAVEESTKKAGVAQKEAFLKEADKRAKVIFDKADANRDKKIAFEGIKNKYSVTHLYENIEIIMYKESFFQTKFIIQPPINILWATFSLCFNFLSGELFGPDSQKYLIFREKMQFSKIRILNND